MTCQDNSFVTEIYTAINGTDVKIYLDNEIAEKENPNSIIWNQPLDCEFDESVLKDKAMGLIIKRYRAEYDAVLESLVSSEKAEMERIRKVTGIKSRGYHIDAGFYIKNIEAKKP
jgi:hypothetical protein